jgi:hypothetical protein
LHAIKKEIVKQLFQIKDEENAESIQPVLSVRVGDRHCSFAISDAITKKVSKLAWYSTEETDENSLEELLSELHNTYYEIIVSYDFPESILMPSKEFDHEKAGAILRSLYSINGASVIVSETIPEWQLHNIHAVPRNIFDLLNKRFAAAKFRNQYSVNIRSAMAAHESGSVLVDFRTDEFSVIVTKQGQLLLSQTFPYAVPEDVIYYLLKLAKQFDLRQDEMLVQVSGLIDKQSALYKDIYQYFLHLEFREADWVLPANEYPAHFFTSLNDLAKCAS